MKPLTREEVLDKIKKSESFEGIEIGDIVFTNFRFQKSVNFSGAIFMGYADFSRVWFTGKAVFTRAKFTDYADFSGATFTGKAVFTRATFTDYADFSGATFTGKAVFTRATFTGKAVFTRATFTGYTDFSGATFTGIANLNEATFTGKSIKNRIKDGINFLIEKIAHFIGFTIVFYYGCWLFLGVEGALYVVIGFYAIVVFSCIFTAILMTIVIGIMLINIKIDEFKSNRSYKKSERERLANTR